MADLGLLEGIASGLQQGLSSYMTTKNMLEDRRLKAEQAVKDEDFRNKQLEAQAKTAERQAQQLDFDKSKFTQDFDYKKQQDAEKMAFEREKLAQEKFIKGREFEVKKANVKPEEQGFKRLDKPGQIQVEEFTKDAAKKDLISNTLKGDLERLKDPKMSPDQKLAHARSMIKTLNSKMGADAVGAEEAQRLASLLEFHVLNFTKPGPVFGRAPIEEFQKQVENTLASLEDAASLSRKAAAEQYSASGLVAPKGLIKDKVGLKNPHDMTDEELDAELRKVGVITK